MKTALLVLGAIVGTYVVLHRHPEIIAKVDNLLHDGSDKAKEALDTVNTQIKNLSDVVASHVAYHVDKVDSKIS